MSDDADVTGAKIPLSQCNWLNLWQPVAPSGIAGRECRVARGYTCPVCGRSTVHPISKNKMRCSKCNTTFDKDTIIP